MAHGFWKKRINLCAVFSNFFCGVFGTMTHPTDLGFTGLFDRHINQIADDGFDVAADVADFGELGGLDLDEWRVGQLRKAAGDLCFADAGGADHEDVLGRDLGTQFFR